MTATPGILSALQSSGLPQYSQAFLAAVAEGEGGTSFRVLYSGGAMLAPNPNIVVNGKIREWTGSLATFPDWGGATAGQSYSTAAGAFQITHSTFDGPDHLASEFGITDFQPGSQIEFAWKLAIRRFPTLGATLLNAVNDPSQLALIPAMLGRTWPGGCDAGFPKRYANNLRTLQTPAQPPAQPPTSPQLASVGISLPNIAQVTDGAGNTVSVPLKWMAAAGVGLMAAVMAGGIMLSHADGELPQRLSVAPDLARQSVDQAARPTSSIATTFRLVPGPLGPLAAPLKRP